MVHALFMVTQFVVKVTKWPWEELELDEIIYYNCSTYNAYPSVRALLELDECHYFTCFRSSGKQPAITYFDHPSLSLDTINVVLYPMKLDTND